jgi:hypothetical protein
MEPSKIFIFIGEQLLMRVSCFVWSGIGAFSALKPDRERRRIPKNGNRIILFFILRVNELI